MSLKSYESSCWLILCIVLTTAGCNRAQDNSSLPTASPIAQSAPQTPTPTPTPSPSPTPIEKMIIGHGWTLRTKQFEAVSHKLKYSIKGEYPYLHASPYHRAIRFNREIRSKIAKQYGYAMTPDPKEFREHVRAFPKEDPLETAEFSYEILFANKGLLSIRFHDIIYSYGAAHPLEDYFSLNFDLKRGTVLKLTSFFKSNTRYRRRLVELCKKGLDDQGVFTYPDAISAELRRHIEWNITREGLVINFDRCAVSACMGGEHSVIIPYHELANILSVRLNRILSR